ncbi:MAG: cupin domain-containing protein [Candidatus Brocadiaceae bacterium]|nr:cupin domain-containing protein [Candidatus Brocadiaceae bacterium]
MKHVHYSEVKAVDVTETGAERVKVRWLIAQDDAAPHFYMRRFEVEPGGQTPHHLHPWEHEVYILEGEGTVFGPKGGEPFGAGDVVYVPPEEEHHFAADRGRPAVFLCLIPKT